MISFRELWTYSLEIEWLIVWSPVRGDAALDAPKIRVGTIRHRTDDAVFAAGNRQTHFVGQGGAGLGDPLTPNNVAAGFVEVGLEQDGRFAVAVQAVLGGASRRKTFRLGPGTIVPFMVSLHDRSGRPELRGTATSLHGVITSGRRPSLLDALVRRLGP